jgi:Ser/Thr protein kinase RdoA (MazF antagonist)
LIHADLVRENIMIDGDQLQLIDFDDDGVGFRLFAMATTLVKNLHEHDYPTLRASLINGYTSVRAIDVAALDLFIVLRTATYVGRSNSRMSETGADIRNARFVSTSRMLAQGYLVSQG